MNNNKNLAQRILYFPLTKIVVGIAACFIVYIITQAAVNLMPLNEELKSLTVASISAALVLAAYVTLYKFYEKRKIIELSTKGFAKNIIAGVLLGAALQALTIYVIYLNHGFAIIAVNRLVYILPALGISISAAVLEEILFRGIIFRIAEEKLGSYIALAISAFIFGAAHLANPNSTLITASGIAIQAGLLLGAAYIYRRNLWFPIALHFSWDFTQSGIFGATMSGNTIGKSLLTTKIEGSTLITGGPFGPEGSLQATLFCLSAAIILMIVNRRQHKIIKPYWIKKDAGY